MSNDYVSQKVIDELNAALAQERSAHTRELANARTAADVNLRHALVKIEGLELLMASQDALLHRLADAVYTSYEDDEGIARCPHCHAVDHERAEDTHYEGCLSIDYAAWDEREMRVLPKPSATRELLIREMVKHVGDRDLATELVDFGRDEGVRIREHRLRVQREAGPTLEDVARKARADLDPDQARERGLLER